jgi:hypothetical protein
MQIAFQIFDSSTTVIETQSSWLLQTNGTYCIEFGDVRLFEYSSDYREKVLINPRKGQIFNCVNNYVGELFLALARVLPYALEAVPWDLTRYLGAFEFERLEQKREQWYLQKNLTCGNENPIWDTYGDFGS